MAFLSTRDIVCTLRENIAKTCDIVVLVGDTGNLVLVGGEVHTDVVTEVLANTVVPSESKLNTGILDVTTIDVGRVGTHNTNHRTSNKPVLSGLLIPVEVHAQTTVEETSIETEVKLLRGLPCKVGVRNDVSVSTGIRKSCCRSQHV